MKKKKTTNNLAYYVQTLNELVQETEKIGENMNPHYERIRECLDQNRLDSISEEELTDIKNIFSEGTQRYHELNSGIKKLTPPVRVMGIHKKLEAAFDKYVSGCEQMVASVSTTTGVDATEFNQAEEVQDEATDVIGFCISRMTGLLMKR